MIAVLTDFQDGIIPNWLILFGIGAGILIGEDVLEKIPIAAIVILLLFPFFRIGAIGAGDIKCFAMISFYLSSDQFIQAIFYSFFIALIMISIKYFIHHIHMQNFFKINSKFIKRFYYYYTSFFKTDFPNKKTNFKNI